MTVEAAGAVARRAGQGAVWVFLAFASGRVLAFGTNLVLATLLSPADFGVVSFAMIAIGALALFQDLGVGAALVYGRRDAREVGGTALTINVATAVLLAALLAAAAPLLAGLGGEDRVVPVVMALAVGLVIESLGAVQNAVLVKELAFGRKFPPEVVPLIGSGAVALVLALLGFGVWSLVLGNLTRTTLRTVLLWWLCTVRPRPEFRLAVAAELLGYGKHVAVVAILGFALFNIDYLVVGRTLGTFELGIYTMAFTIAGIPVVLVGQSVKNAAFPAYAKLQHDRASLAGMVLATTSVALTLSVPIGAAILLGADAFVQAVLGEKWLGVIAPLRVLAVFAVIRTVAFTFAPVYKAIGRPDVEWRLILLNLALLVPLMLYLVQYGVVGVAVAELVVAAVCLPVTALTWARLLDCRFGRAWPHVWPQTLGVGVVALVVGAAFTQPALAAARAQPVGAAALIALAVGAYAAILLGTDRQIRSLARAGLKRPSPPGRGVPIGVRRPA